MKNNGVFLLRWGVLVFCQFALWGYLVAFFLLLIQECLLLKSEFLLQLMLNIINDELETWSVAYLSEGLEVLKALDLIRQYCICYHCVLNDIIKEERANEMESKVTLHSIALFLQRTGMCFH